MKKEIYSTHLSGINDTPDTFEWETLNVNITSIGLEENF